MEREQRSRRFEKIIRTRRRNRARYRKERNSDTILATSGLVISSTKKIISIFGLAQEENHVGVGRKMRVGIFMLMGLYCVWQIKSNGATVLSVTKKKGAGLRDEEKSSTSDGEYLFPPPLVSPYGGTLKLLVGISLPISLTGGRTLSFGINFQFQYPLPQNATFFTHYFDDSAGRLARRWKRTTTNGTLIDRSRKKIVRARLDRTIFYRSLEVAIESWGGNGSECVMKSICEAAETPLWDQGLVGQLLHFVLTPSYRTGNAFDTSRDNDDYYLRASIAGKNGYDCSRNYPGCPEGFGLLDRISRLHYTD